MITCTCGAINKIKIALQMNEKAEVERFGVFTMTARKKKMAQGKIVTKTITFHKKRNVF